MKTSPTIRLLLGLLVTLAAVTAFCIYSLHQLSYLRKLQTDTIDLNRHDSLLLLRVQNDVNLLGLKLQEMTEGARVAKIADYSDEFARLHLDLNDAIAADRKLADSTRDTARQARLTASLESFWAIWQQVYRQASSGDEQAARELASTDLSDQQIVLAHRLSRLLESNNEAEANVDKTIASVYEKTERQTYLFLAGTIAAILFTSLYLIYSNRQMFERMEALSRQRRVLAARLIKLQEEVLRSVSRELHDEFGQILTAIGAMLSHAERKGVPPDSPFRKELTEVREITQNTLEKMRSLSQMLHPALLDDYGLAKGIEWYVGVFQRHTGIRTELYIEGAPVPITGPTATHCFRIVQEALTNAAKHSKTASARIDLTFSSESLAVLVRDYGVGMPPTRKGAKPGLGLIAMRERAEILSAHLSVSSIPAPASNSGTTVSLTMPLHQQDLATSDEPEPIGELLTS